VSAFVDPKGQIIKQAPLFKISTLTENIIPMGGMTPFARLGEGLIMLIIMSLFIGLFVIRFGLNHHNKRQVSTEI